MNRLLKITTFHPWMTLLFLGVAVIGGIWSYQNVAIDAIPDIGQKQVIVLSKWMGRSPKDIEDQVTYPLSVSLLAVPGADSVRGKSLFGFSFVQVTFKDDIDIYWARSRVSELLNTVKSTLPPEVTVELGPDATALGQVLYYVLQPSKPTNPADLRSVQDYVVKYALQSVEGVSEVASIGGYNREYKVDVDPKLLRFHKIGLDAISKAIRDSNDEVGANTLEQGGMEFVIRSKGFLGHDTKSRKEVLKDLENTVVISRKGVPLRIKDLATVSNGVATRRGALDYNGSEAVGGIVIMRIGENPRAVIERVKEKMENLQRSLDGIELKIIYDRTNLVDETVATLTTAVSQQVIITVFIVFLFLLNFRTSLLVALTLPAAVILTFVGMKAIGLDANIMSLAGIAIAIGNMVDMGIVVAESIHQAFVENDDSRKSRIEIVYGALSSVAPAIMTASLTTIVSFIPVFFLTGRDYKLFAPLAWTKTFALLAAFFVSVLLIPSLYIVWRAASNPSRWGEGLIGKKSYERFVLALNWSFARRKLIIIAPTLMFLAGVLVWQGIGPFLKPIEKVSEKAGIFLDHVPGYSSVKSTLSGIKSDDWIALDEGSLFYMPTLLPSSAFSTSLEVLQTQDTLIRKIPEVRDVLGKIGRADTALDPAPAAMIETYVMLKPKEEWRESSTIQTIWDEINQLATLPGVTPASFLQPIEGRVVMLQSGIKAKMAVRIYGDSLTQLAQSAKNVAEILKSSSLVNPVTVNPDIVLGKPYGEFVPDRFAAARYGMGIQKINQTIATAVGGTKATMTIEGRERFPVQVRYLRGERDGLDKLKSVPIITPKGEVIPLEKLANFSTSWGPAVISSEDARLVAHVAFSPSGSVGDLETASGVEELIARSVEAKSLELPNGFETEIVGSFQNQIEANRRLLILIPIVLLINLFLIFLQFKDVVVSLIVFSGIPIAFGGAMLAVKVAGVEMNTAIWVGMIALFGISVDDGLIICTNIKQYVFGKKFSSISALQDAVIEATKRRFRPCFMTTTTTLIALIPVLFATGRGADVARAMGLPIVGGMLLATFELLLVPSMFMLYARRSNKFISNDPEEDLQS